MVTIPEGHTHVGWFVPGTTKFVTGEHPPSLAPGYIPVFALTTSLCEGKTHDIEHIYQVGDKWPTMLLCRRCGEKYDITNAEHYEPVVIDGDVPQIISQPLAVHGHLLLYGRELYWRVE